MAAVSWQGEGRQQASWEGLGSKEYLSSFLISPSLIDASHTLSLSLIMPHAKGTGLFL